MAIKSRTAVPLALLMLAVALACCAAQDIAATTSTTTPSGGTTTNTGSNVITITGSSNIIGGDCYADIYADGKIALVKLGYGVSVCEFWNQINSQTYVTINLNESMCKTVAGQYVKVEGGNYLCVMPTKSPRKSRTGHH